MKIQSNGMGVQSFAMYLMSSTGILPRFDYSIFVDTGLEKPQTYKALEWLQNWQKKNNGIPLIVIRKKNLYLDLLNAKNSSGNRFAPIPAYTEGGKGMLRRQCTREYKSDQINAKIKEILGLSKHSRYPRILSYIGFSIDELRRVSRPREKWRIIVHPFCNIWATVNKITHKQDKFFPGNGITRSDIINWLYKNNYPNPGKSSCAFCPYMSNSEWIHIKNNNQLWLKMIELDSTIRNSSKSGVKEKIYLHRSGKPLEIVDLKENQEELFEICDSGICHI